MKVNTKDCQHTLEVIYPPKSLEHLQNLFFFSYWANNLLILMHCCCQEYSCIYMIKIIVWCLIILHSDQFLHHTIWKFPQQFKASYQLWPIPWFCQWLLATISEQSPFRENCLFNIDRGWFMPQKHKHLLILGSIHLSGCFYYTYDLSLCNLYR